MAERFLGDHNYVTVKMSSEVDTSGKFYRPPLITGHVKTHARRNHRHYRLSALCGGSDHACRSCAWHALDSGIHLFCAGRHCLGLARQGPDHMGCALMRLVGVRGFEPPAPASRTQCSTRLSYTPRPTVTKGGYSGRGKTPQAGRRQAFADGRSLPCFAVSSFLMRHHTPSHTIGRIR